ncbi:hypothetical protein RhiLY_07131 [Ceratobasidium sp. AG-Ba]|nr:hypothetical protein RhiLY_07131 [Ceratobasidium sp. AG-Ba]
MAKHDTLSDADGTSLSTSDRGQPIVTYVRVGRGMVKVTKYEKQDKAVREEKKREHQFNDGRSIHSFDSSQPAPHSAPSIKSRASSGSNPRSMPGWIPKFKKSKKGKKALAALAAVPPTPDLPRDPFSATPSSSQHDAGSSRHGHGLAAPDAPRTASPIPKENYLSPPPLMPTPPSSPTPKQLRPLRATHSHGDLSSDPQTATPDMWASIAQLESELVARYGRGAVPQFEALRERAQQMSKIPQPERQYTQQSYDWPERSELPYVSEEPGAGRPSYSNRPAEPDWYPEQPPVPRARNRTETLPAKRGTGIAHPTRTFVDDLDIYAHDTIRGGGRIPQPSRAKDPSPELPEEEDSDDGALAYLQALGLEPAEGPRKVKSTQHAPISTQPRPALQTTRAATLPTPIQPVRYPTDQVSRLEQARHDALVASIVNPPPAALEQYSSRQQAPRPDYVTTTKRVPSIDALGLMVDASSSRSPSPLPDTPPVNDVPPGPDSPGRKSLRQLPPRPPPPNTFAPFAPANSIAPLNVTRSPGLVPPESPLTPAQISPVPSLKISPRPQPSPMSLAPPPANSRRGTGPGASQLALPLVRVRITSPPHRGALRALPALIMLTVGARAAFAAATWAQMVAYCARNAGVTIAKRGGGGALRVAVEERMAELTSPGGGRGNGDEEVGFGLGYYISVEMTLEGETVEEYSIESSVPVATMSIPLPTTMGEVATTFRERKDIRKALS